MGNKLYDDDSNRDGPSKFFKSDSNWAYSSTGVFMDDEPPLNTYVWSNTSHLSIKDPRLYMTARFSPLSLTYYGFCLMNGNYTVDLHFAEIVFTDDVTYISLGRRIFDVYIQVIWHFDFRFPNKETRNMLVFLSIKSIGSHFCLNTTVYRFCL